MNHMPYCPVCGNRALPEFYEPRGYALCPRCGVILRRLRDRLVPLYNVDREQLTLEASFDKLGADSLDVAELVMALEEEYGIDISDKEAEGIKTVEDLVRWLESHSR